MKTLKQAIVLAQMLATVTAEVSGVDCMIAMGPTADGVHWEVISRDGACVGAGVVPVGDGVAIADTDAAPVGAGRN